MTPERWAKIEEIYHDALDRDSGARMVFVQEACLGDEDLRREVESLLAQRSGDLLNEPAIKLARVVDFNDKLAFSHSLIGEQLGPYEILAKIGQGGMGVVYRARDTRLGRDVAIKVLPPEVVNDPERLARFRREAKLLASLNHPNIAIIHGLEDSGGAHLLVMELVKGSTLAERMRGGPVLVNDALEIGLQVSEALEHAHQHNVIHRDLKPSNLMLTPEGRVKVLDFGLAKVFTDEVAEFSKRWNTDIDRETLITQSAEVGTVAGRILGTVGYMSPEQSRGEAVDQRTDIWAFGCLLFELIAGKRAFEGNTFEQALEALRSVEPDWNALPAKTPAQIRKLLKHCLQKDPARRLAAISEVRRTLDQGLHRRNHWAIGAAAIFIVVVILFVVALMKKNESHISDPTKWVKLTNFSDSVSQPALSPDGQMIAFIRGPGTFFTPGQIYLKQLPDGDLRQLTNDELDKMSPMFSPDGSRIAYTTVGSDFQWDTWLASTSGGKPELWLKNASGLIWVDRQRVLLSEMRTGLHMVLVESDDQNSRRREVYAPAQELGMVHRSYPSPDGRWVLAVEMNAAQWLPCRLIPMDGSSAGRTVGPLEGACTSAAWSPDGKWMYFSSSANGEFHLWRQRFSGTKPEQITAGPTEQEGIAVTADGHSLITAVGQRQRPLMLHRDGHDMQITPEGYTYDPKFTADGHFLTYHVLKGSQVYTDPAQLWVTDLTSGNSEQLVPELSLQGLSYDVSKDGKELLFAARDRSGLAGMWLARLGGSLPSRRIPGIEGDWAVFGPPGEIFFRSGDGFIYGAQMDGTKLRKISMQPVKRIFSISPDKQWLVIDNGQTMLYPVNAEQPIKLQGGFILRWSTDGKLLYFTSPKVGMSFGAAGVTYVIPLHHGEMFPKVIRDGLHSEQDLAKIPGVQIIEVGDVAPGPQSGVYAYTREVTQRNLFRIPIP